MPIYTKNGDAGETDLYGGTRVRKSVKVIKALGELDELNAFLGLTRLSLQPTNAGKIAVIQSDLFILGSAVAGAQLKVDTRIYLSKRVSQLEQEIDTLTAKLPMLKSFILPNGCESSARLHLARAMCRRCERALVALAKYPFLVPYINRLSDYLFTLARFENRRRKVKEETVSSTRR